MLGLTALTFIDSSGLRVLLEAHQRAEQHGGSLHLAAPHQRVIRVLQVTGLHRLPATHPTLEQALAGATPAL